MPVYGAQIESRSSSTWDNPAAWVTTALGNLGYPNITGTATTAGVTVTPDLAMKLTTVFVCIDLLARTQASLPLATIEQMAGSDGRARRRHALENQIYSLLHDSPNPEMTAYTWRFQQMVDLLSRGTCYSKIERNGAGRVVALWPQPARYVTPRRTGANGRSGALVYEIGLPGEPVEFIPAEQMLVVIGFTLDGLTGLSPLGIARNGVGLAMSAEDYNAYFFRNGGLVKDILQHPGKLGEEAEKRLRETWRSRHGVAEEARGTAILEEGMEYKVTTIPAEDVLFLDSRRFNREEIASLFHVPPVFVNEYGRATWGNGVVMDTALVKYALAPWLTAWEQALSWKLLTPAERQRYYFRHNAGGLLRGDATARSNSYGAGISRGYYSINDVRELEDMDPIDGGDVYLVPLNMTPVDQIGQPPADPAPARTNLRPFLEADAARIIRREASDLTRAAGKQAVDLAAWRADYYAPDGEHAQWIADVLQPWARALGRDSEVIETIVQRWCASQAGPDAETGNLLALIAETLEIADV